MAAHEERVKSRGKGGAVVYRWRVRYRDPGSRDQVSIACPDEITARGLAGKINTWHALHEGEAYPRHTASARPAATLRAVAVAWLRDVMRLRSDRTLEAYTETADRFILAHGGDNASIGTLTSAAIEAVDAANITKGHAPSTRRHTIARLALWHVWAWERRSEYPGVTEPRRIERPAAPAARVVAPTWTEVDAMIRNLTPGSVPYRAAWLARCTGLRAAQCVAVRWDDVDLDAGTMRVLSGKSASEKAARRVVPLAPVLVTELRTWDRTDPRVVPARADTPRKGVRDAWRLATEQGHVRPEVHGASEATGRRTGCALHALRKGLVTNLRKSKADTEAVEFLVGHADAVGGIRGHYVDADALNLSEVVALVPGFNPPAPKGEGKALPFPALVAAAK